MPFDLASGQWREDPNYNYFGQQRQQQMNYASGFGNIGDGSVPSNPGGGAPDPRNPGNDPTQPGYGGAPATGGYPNYPQYPGMIGDGTIPTAPTVPNTGRNQSPSGLPGDMYLGPAPAPTNGMPPYGGPVYPGGGTSPAAAGGASNPTTVAAPPPPTVTGTGNPGNDRNNPPDQSGDWFWSGTAGHWVDKTGQRDATGRMLTTGEQAWWQGNNQRRASGQLGADDARMMQWGNTQYPVNFADPYTGAGATTAGVQTPTAAGTPPPPGAATTAYPKMDPNFLAQVQAALESPNGPYAGRQTGDFAPPDAPPNVRNPQTQADWQARFYWFAAHPEALSNPSAPRAAAAPPVSDVYSDAGANQSFAELRGVVDDARLKAAQDLYGWQLGPNGLASNDAAVAQATQMKQAHPEFSYQVYQRPDGTYGIAARELDQKAQQARNFYAPGMAPKPAASSGYGGGNNSNYRGGGYTPPYQPPAPPQGWTHIQPGPVIDTRAAGGSVNPANPAEGSIININGQLLQRRGGRWEPVAYQGGVGQNISPI